MRTIMWAIAAWLVLALVRAAVAEGELGTRYNAGAPVAGTDEVQTGTITGSPTGGTFRLKFEGFITGTIAYNATGATIQTAIRLLPCFQDNSITVTGSAGGPYTFTFVTNQGKKAISTIIALADNLMTGGSSPTLGMVETTPGVDATERGTPPGGELVDTTNQIKYINTGTALAPTWTKVGLQT